MYPGVYVCVWVGGCEGVGVCLFVYVRGGGGGVCGVGGGGGASLVGWGGCLSRKENVNTRVVWSR